MSTDESETAKRATAPGLLPPKFVEAERILIAQRRQAAGLPAEAKPPHEPAAQRVIGVALSGGGIRSATFCLGLFQSLARHQLVRRVDYLSTVSGGGYFGSFLGRMFTRDWATSASLAKAGPDEVSRGQGGGAAEAAAGAGTASAEGVKEPLPPRSNPPGGPRGHRRLNAKRFLENLRSGPPPAAQRMPPSVASAIPDAVARVETALADSQSPPLIWLRESGNYLAPGGANDTVLDASIYLRNWLSLLIVMLTLGFAVFALANSLRFCIGSPGGFDLAVGFEGFLKTLAGAHLWWTPAIAIPALAIVVALVPLGMAYWLAQARMGAWAVWAGCIVIIGAAAAGCSQWTGHLRIVALLPGLIALLAVLWRVGFGVSAGWNGVEHPAPWIRNHMARWLRGALLLVAGSLVFAFVDCWGQSLYAVVRYTGNWRQAAPAFAGVLGLTALAPLARSLLLNGAGAPGKLKLPLQFLALAVALVLALVLLTGLAFASHSLAWEWKLPACAHGEPPGESPGGRIWNQWGAKTNAVQLTAGRLIQVAPSQAEPPRPGNPLETPRLDLVWEIFAVSGCLSLLFARNIGFLNLSSYHTLYSARIVRAYQGASDLKRWGEDADVTRAEPDDDIAWSDYKPHARGGPLHLVNCTINCTESVETRMESTTAKGLNLCVGPAGISHGQSHAAFARGASSSSVTPFINGEPAAASAAVESLPLGDWVGISGAAFTTGLGNVGGGAGTSFGTSLLCGLFNVRLGYWWSNALSPSGRMSVNNFLPVQTYLADEFSASFHIVNRDHWYLSDGGHFENTAAYELIRRRVGFIVLADCGTDPDGAFDDLGNLGRRVRIDFGVEIVFPDAAGVEALLKRKSGNVGSLADLCPEETFTGRDGAHPVAAAIRSMQKDGPEPLQARRARKHAAIAEVRYPEGGSSILLVVKPVLTGDEPEDIINYQRNNLDFPQQSTAEQFYNEAQWESYRGLGEHAMNSVLADDWVRAQFQGGGGLEGAGSGGGPATA